MATKSRQTVVRLKIGPFRNGGKSAGTSQSWSKDLGFESRCNPDDHYPVYLLIKEHGWWINFEISVIFQGKIKIKEPRIRLKLFKLPQTPPDPSLLSINRNTVVNNVENFVLRILGGSLQLPLPWWTEHSSQSGLPHPVLGGGAVNQGEHPVWGSTPVRQWRCHGFCSCIQVTSVNIS